jgi:hypothetical protein
MLPGSWNTLTPDEKFEARLAGWQSTKGKSFATPEAAQTYQRRAQRLKDIIQLKRPDRIPCLFIAGGFIAEYAGVTHAEMFYDYEKAIQAAIKFHKDFAPDYPGAGNFLPGKVYDRLGYKLYRWPGSSLAPNLPFQCLEGEYMRPDEYDALIANPEGYCIRTYMPRVFGALAGWQMLPSFFGSIEMPFVPFMLAPIGMPPVQEAFLAFLEAGQATLEWLGANAQVSAVTMGEMGLPAIAGGFTKAPFDFVGDTLRGTRGVMLDMYRRPDKLLAACDCLVPIAIKMAVDGANAAQNPLILIPLHKGADGFMSNGDFIKFYWPSLKAVLLGLIGEGVVPFLFVEGSYNHRLDIIAASDLPAGKTVWMFDQTDLAAVKEKFGSWACFGGNVPASLFKAGTPQQMEDYVKNLIDTVGQDGGYFLSPGIAVDDAEPENVHAFIDTGKEYGVYR